MAKSSVQEKAFLSLIKMLHKEKYTKFALSMQIQFEKNCADESIHAQIKDLLSSGLTSKKNDDFKIKDHGHAFECSMLPEIQFLLVSCNQIFAIFDPSYSTEEGINIIKNIVSGINNILQGELVASRVGIAINYKWDCKENMEKDKMRIKQFTISSDEILEDNLNFNIIMQEDVLEKIVALDLFFQAKLIGIDLISKIDTLYNNAINNWNLEKMLEKLNPSKLNPSK